MFHNSPINRCWCIPLDHRASHASDGYDRRQPSPGLHGDKYHVVLLTRHRLPAPSIRTPGTLHLCAVCLPPWAAGLHGRESAVGCSQVLKTSGDWLSPNWPFHRSETEVKRGSVTCPRARPTSGRGSPHSRLSL